MNLKRRIIGFLYVAASLLILGLLALSFFWYVPSEEQPTFLTLFGIAILAIGAFRAYEDYRAAQQREYLRHIENTIRNVMWEMRQK